MSVRNIELGIISVAEPDSGSSDLYIVIILQQGVRHPNLMPISIPSSNGEFQPDENKGMAETDFFMVLIHQSR